MKPVRLAGEILFGTWGETWEEKRVWQALGEVD
jgi:hypothetical protein